MEKKMQCMFYVTKIIKNIKIMHIHYITTEYR